MYVRWRLRVMGSCQVSKTFSQKFQMSAKIWQKHVAFHAHLCFIREIRWLVIRWLPLVRRMFWVTWQKACEHIPSHCVAQFLLHTSSQSSIFGFRFYYNMIWIKVFYNISFPKDRYEVITADKNNVGTCNDVMQNYLTT